MNVVFFFFSIEPTPEFIYIAHIQSLTTNRVNMNSSENTLGNLSNIIIDDINDSAFHLTDKIIINQDDHPDIFKDHLSLENDIHLHFYDDPTLLCGDFINNTEVVDYSMGFGSRIFERPIEEISLDPLVYEIAGFDNGIKSENLFPEDIDLGSFAVCQEPIFILDELDLSQNFCGLGMNPTDFYSLDSEELSLSIELYSEENCLRETAFEIEIDQTIQSETEESFDLGCQIDQLWCLNEFPEPVNIAIHDIIQKVPDTELIYSKDGNNYFIIFVTDITVGNIFGNYNHIGNNNNIQI